MDLEDPAQDCRDLLQPVEGCERVLVDELDISIVGTFGTLAVHVHQLAVTVELAARGLVDQGEKTGDRRFAGTRLTDEGSDLAAVNGQVDAVEGVDGHLGS